MVLLRGATGTAGWTDSETDRQAFTIAMNLIPFVGIAFLWFIGVVRTHIGAREDRFLASVYFGSGVLFLGMCFVAAAGTQALLAAHAQYGERFLAVIRAYCAERGLAERLRLRDAAPAALRGSGFRDDVRLVAPRAAGGGARATGARRSRRGRSQRRVARRQCGKHLILRRRRERTWSRTRADEAAAAQPPFPAPPQTRGASPAPASTAARRALW